VILALATVWLLAISGGVAADHPASELLGVWHGTSICAKADWNRSCHDEEALYDFHPGEAAGHVIEHAYKIVNGRAEFMGDLDYAWDDTLHAWVADFANERVHVHWILEPHGDALEGRAELLPSLNIGRQIRVSRIHGESPWPLTPGP
jgi:hypothetical protein